MVGWIPPAELRLERCYDFLRRIQNAQGATLAGSSDTAYLLHYDARSADLKPYAWPVLGGARVTPNMLDWHRHTHYYIAPSCLCALLDGTTYSETIIGLVQRVTQPATPECLGQYAATCAKQRCGYYVLLEPFYSHSSLLVKSYPERVKPVLCLDPFFFTTGDTAETVQRAGLRQIEVLRDDSNTGLRGTRHLLRREDPERFWKLEDEIEKLLTKGLPGTKFWDLFVQCTQCNYVMPAHHFPYYHECGAAIIRGYELTASVRSYRSTVLSDKCDGNAGLPDLDSNMVVEPVDDDITDDSDNDLPTLESLLAATRPLPSGAHAPGRRHSAR